MLRAVVFDLDNTLYPERAYVDSGFRAVAGWVEERLGIPGRRALAELGDLFDRGVRGHTFDRFLEAHGIDPDGFVPEMVRVYRDHEPDIALDPGARALLRRLRARYRLGLVTDGPGAVQRRKVAALGLARWFHAIVFTDDLGPDHGKPSTRPFEVVLGRLGALPREAVYVGDNPAKDFLGARRVGMRTVRVRSPLGLHRGDLPPTAEHAPDAETGDLSSLETVLAALDRTV